MKEDPTIFYQEQIKIYSEQLKITKKLLLQSSILRLFVFMATAFGVYFFFGNTIGVFSTLIIGVVAFLYLITRHSKLQYKRDFERQLISINEIEVQVKNKWCVFK